VNQHEFLYRDANLSDAETIVDFQVAMASETERIRLSRDVCQAGVRGVFADSQRGRYFVAEEGGRVIASLLVTYEWSDWRNGTIWWLQSVYVVPEVRGRGAFSGLYRHVQQLAWAAPDVRGLRLYVDERNTAAQTVYQRLGMAAGHYRVLEAMK
jgi:GNAT superfamily N-acetyltransferase